MKTTQEISEAISERFSVDAGEFARVTTIARFGPPTDAGEAARRARIELRDLKRRLRRGLFVLDRARGLFQLGPMALDPRFPLAMR